MSYAQYRTTARIIGKLPHNVDGNADGNRIPPHHAASHQTPLKSVILHRIPPYHAQRIGLRIRRSQVRVLPSALRKYLQTASKSEGPGFAPGPSDTDLTVGGPLYAAYSSRGSGNSMPYFGAAASVRSISSGPNGGALPPSCAGRPASKKKFSIPAGVKNTSILAGAAPTFLKRCKVPLGMLTKEPALAMKVRSPLRISSSPSST